MIKDAFNRRTPVDMKVIGRYGRYAIVRGSYPGPKGAVCQYGLYMPGAESCPATDDGIVLSCDEVKQLAELLPVLVSAGEIREITPLADFKAALEAREAAKEAARKTPRPLW